MQTSAQYAEVHRTLGGKKESHKHIPESTNKTVTETK